MNDPATFHLPDDPSHDWEEEYKQRTSWMLNYLGAYIKRDFGERCSTFEPDCPTCKLWKLRDEFNEITS